MKYERLKKIPKICVNEKNTPPRDPEKPMDFAKRSNALRDAKTPLISNLSNLRSRNGKITKLIV